MHRVYRFIYRKLDNTDLCEKPSLNSVDFISYAGINKESSVDKNFFKTSDQTSRSVAIDQLPIKKPSPPSDHIYLFIISHGSCFLYP